MHKKIKMLSMVSITSLMIGVNIQSVNAFENTSLYTSYSNVDVAEDSLITYIEPLDENYLLSQQDKNNSIELYGLNIPTSTHNLKTQGKMSFSGSSKNTTLYTNKRFTGSSKVEYRIENHSDNKLTVRVRKANVTNTTVETLTIPPRAAMGGFLNLSSSSSYYLRFDGANSGPTNFSGYLAHKG